MLPHIIKRFFEKKIIVRVPHTKGLPLTDINQYGEEEESRQWIESIWMVHSQAEPWRGFDYIGKPVICSKSQGMD